MHESARARVRNCVSTVCVCVCAFVREWEKESMIFIHKDGAKHGKVLSFLSYCLLYFLGEGGAFAVVDSP